MPFQSTRRLRKQPAAMLVSMKIFVKWLLCAAALLGLTYVYSGVQVQSFGSAMIAALVIGLLNTIIRPILVILTLPVMKESEIKVEGVAR